MPRRPNGLVLNHELFRGGLCCNGVIGFQGQGTTPGDFSEESSDSLPQQLREFRLGHFALQLPVVIIAKK